MFIYVCSRSEKKFHDMNIYNFSITYIIIIIIIMRNCTQSIILCEIKKKNGFTSLGDEEKIVLQIKNVFLQKVIQLS